MSTLQIPVKLHKLKKAKSSQQNSSERCRVHYGTVYFPKGTTANDVCEYISRRQQGNTGNVGLWLLQTVNGNQTMTGGQLEMADDSSTYSNIKDSKYQLTEASRYIALHYTGPDIYLVQP